MPTNWACLPVDLTVGNVVDGGPSVLAETGCVFGVRTSGW
jgi:hypothetical protein